jgi:uncharacterized protein
VKLTHYSPADYRRTQWKNGGGTTLELLKAPAPDGFLWRISIADVETSGAFSEFPGIDRQIMLIEGNGMALDFSGAAAPVSITEPLRPLAFRGEWRTECRLIDGPIKDFNLMVRRDWGTGMLSGHAPDLEHPVALGASPLMLVHVLSGRIECLGQGFAAGATLRLENSDPLGLDILPIAEATRFAAARIFPKRVS